MNGVSTAARFQGAMLGPALGDTMGFPAMYHRTLQLPWQRSVLWDFSKEADRHRINKFALPFTLSSPEEQLAICATDDGEYAVVVALILLACDSEPTRESLFEGWQKYVAGQRYL